MEISRLRQSAVLTALAIVLICPAILRAQDTSSLTGKASSMLTGDQMAKAKSALCSAVAKHFPSATSISPSTLTNPAVMTTASTSFASSEHMPVSGASSMLKNFVSQHASDIIEACAVSNAEGSLKSKLPGGSIPAMPKIPGY
jgi:hypothetical protein